MGHTLTLELSDQAFEVIQRQAEANGVPVESLVSTFLEQQSEQMAQLLRSTGGRQAARTKFEHHFGTLELADPTTLDNDSIDADLAVEYASAHPLD
ncbi:MAG: hypothetical protein ACFB12_01550 [Leptolyngbyaceae cyanobacterium]